MEARALARPPVKSMSTNLSFVVVLVATPAGGLLLDAGGVACAALKNSSPETKTLGGCWWDRRGFSAPLDPPLCSSFRLATPGLPQLGLLGSTTPTCATMVEDDSSSPSSLELSDTNLPLRWTSFPPLTFVKWPPFPPLPLPPGACNPTGIALSSRVREEGGEGSSLLMCTSECSCGFLWCDLLAASSSSSSFSSPSPSSEELSLAGFFFCCKGC